MRSCCTGRPQLGDWNAAALYNHCDSVKKPIQLYNTTTAASIAPPAVWAVPKSHWKTKKGHQKAALALKASLDRLVRIGGLSLPQGIYSIRLKQSWREQPKSLFQVFITTMMEMELDMCVKEIETAN